MTDTGSEYPHITLDPEVHEGQPCIAESGVRVAELATAHEEGQSVEDLQQYFPVRHLTLAEIYAALAYFQDHRDELEAVRVEDLRLADVAKRERDAEILRHYLGK